MSDLIQTAKEIQSRIDLLKKMRAELRDRTIAKAQAKANYEKVLAITLIKLKNGDTFQLGDVEVTMPPATTSEKIARGICWKECLQMEESEALYKSLIVNIETVKAELNGFQSINRYLDES